MKDFMFLFYTNDEEVEKIPEEEMKAIMAKWAEWTKKLTEKGIYNGGDRLASKNIRTFKRKDKILTDGPFSESKEIVAGYVSIKAKDLEEASEIAQECPIFLVNGSLEIRTSHVPQDEHHKLS